MKEENTKKKIKASKIVISLISVVLTCFYPCGFMYLQNVNEVGPDTIIFPFLTYVLIAFFILIVSFLLFFSIEKSSFFTCICMIFFMNFVLIQNLIVRVLSFFSYKILILCICIILTGLVAFIKKNRIDVNSGLIIISCIFGGLIVFNCISAIPSFIKGRKVIKPVKVEQYAKDRQFDGNFYYFILDEYGGDENLEYYANYDNDEIKKFMQNEGFSWSSSSHNYESIATNEIVPNILNLNYVCEVGGIPELNLEYTRKPVLYEFFKNLGYEINIFNHKGFLKVDDDNNLISSVQENHEILNSEIIYKRIFEQGMVSVFMESLFHDKKKNNKEDTSKFTSDLDEAFDCAKNISDVGSGNKSFNIFYIQCPHVPFLYNKDGKNIRLIDTENYDDVDIYTGQLQYVNTQMKEIVKNIKQNDPKSVIVFQSDHGLRYAYHCMYKYKRKDYDSKKETRMMQNVLNCVYMGNGEKLEVEGDTCINTWRKILNSLYKTDYSMLEERNDYTFKWKYVNVMR